MMFENHLRVVRDFPKAGIEFLDISPLLENPELFKNLIEKLAEATQGFGFSKIAAIESRGFILGAALAQRLHKGLVMIRKKGKLPGPTVQHSYDLEYGSDTIEMLSSSVEPGEKILVLDDVLATGGTAAATQKLVEKVGGEVSGFVFFIEIGFLNGGNKLAAPFKAILKR